MVHLTAKNFEIETKSSDEPAVVMFYAVWCGKCAMMKPVVEKVAKKYAGRIKFCEVEIEESAVLAAEYGADIVPTFVMFKDHGVESIMQGVLEEHVFEERVRELL
ncbi:MAG: thioredoxin domain-containing protein [Lachnoclostridium sp.]|jgi:thioredoxin 1